MFCLQFYSCYYLGRVEIPYVQLYVITLPPQAHGIVARTSKYYMFDYHGFVYTKKIPVTPNTTEVYIIVKTCRVLFFLMKYPSLSVTFFSNHEMTIDKCKVVHRPSF